MRGLPRTSSGTVPAGKPPDGARPSWTDPFSAGRRSRDKMLLKHKAASNRAELAEIERFALPQPHDVRGVIGKIVAAVAMGKHREMPAMSHQPFQRFADAG